MREHETQYYCIPQESVVESRDGPKCAVCGVFNPDPKHLNTHNVPECRHKFFKRKKLLTEHYEEHHGIDDGSLLADQSKHTTHKTCFPCGFCASPFDSLNEQINHIDAVHYRLSEHISGWDPNKVIRGLLSQPGVSEHWRSALAANPGCQESLFTWHPKIVQNLKHRLEMSQEPPGVLCRVAIAESNYGGTELHHVGSMQAASLTGSAMNTSQSIRKPQHRTGLSPLPPVSESGSTTHFPQAVASTIHSQRPTLSWNGPYDSDLCAVYEDQPAPQIASKTLKSSSSATYHDANNRTQPHATPSNAESFTQPHHPAFAPLIMSASSNLQAFEGQVGAPHSSRSSSQSQGMSSSITTNPYSRQVAEAHTYPAQARMGYLHPPMETQSAASPLSRNHPISQSGQINSSFNSRAQSKFAAQHSHQETIDNTNVDSDNTQRPGHDQAQFRDQRQYH